MAHSKAFEPLSSLLRARSYTFICPSPESQGRVLSRRKDEDAKNLVDVFGWSLPAEESVLRTLLEGVELEQLLDEGILERSKTNKAFIRSTVRISNFYLPHVGKKTSIETLYYIHSAFPTSSDGVFFGPDTYLFLTYLTSVQSFMTKTPKNLVDICCGAGAGAIHLAREFRDATVFGLDLNPKALKLGSFNAVHAMTPQVQLIESNLFANLPKDVLGKIDVIVSNPPYIASAPEGEVDLATFADGGSKEGLELAIRIIDEGFDLLTQGGLFVIYTGVTIGVSNPSFDPFLSHLQGLKRLEVLDYRILHPDMWPEEIGKGAYAYAGRIQAVGTVVRKY